MIRISNIKYSVLLDETNLPEFTAKKYKLGNIKDFRIVKQSIDARKKDDVHYVYTVDVSVDNESKLIKKHKNISRPVYKKYTPPAPLDTSKRVVVAGFGPAGMMCAYILTKAGYKVIVLERGEKVDERIKSVENFKKGGPINPESNIQFGEGGAGTFSDGKLTTGVNDIRTGYVLEEFVRHGAPDEILYKAKPHIGTDNLVGMVKNFREDIIGMGSEIRFLHKLSGINSENNSLKSVSVTHNGEIYEIETDALVIATGHSARDVFKMLKDLGVSLQRKTFSVGARIEHFQEQISRWQYGDMYKLLPPADYKLSVKTSSGRSIYTFCMCPGGEVIAAASEEGGVVVNGMSHHARDLKNSNAAVAVSVLPEDYDSTPMGAIEFQRNLERRAFAIGGGNYTAPIELLGDYIGSRTKGFKTPSVVMPSYTRSMTSVTDISAVFPDFVNKELKRGLSSFGKKLQGFDSPYAVLTAVESRTSSPIRILRNELGVALGHSSVYPCGEGAGYAGGITSAAVDGIKTALLIMKRFAP